VNIVSNLKRLASPHDRSDTSGLSRPRFPLNSSHRPTTCAAPPCSPACAIATRTSRWTQYGKLHVPRGKEGYLHDLQRDPCMYLNRCDIAIGPAAGSGGERLSVKQTSTFAIMWKRGNIQRLSVYSETLKHITLLLQLFSTS
jgi:hypothetical protein